MGAPQMGAPQMPPQMMQQQMGPGGYGYPATQAIPTGYRPPHG